jgi:Na+/proline symporter
MFSTSPLDWGLVLLYFGFLAAVWLRLLGKRSTAVEYLVAGRRVTLPAFVATLVATWYGGILGVGEYSYRYGISNWLVFGAPYYVGALLFAIFYARRAREAALYTIPDLLARSYGRGVAMTGALAVFLVSAPAAYVLMLGTLFAAMFGLPLVPCVVASALLSLFYIYRGGMRTVVFTDQVQFVLMYAGFAVMFAFLVARYGGLGFLHRSLPPAHFTWNGGNPPQAILVWYFIALSALVDPGFWQRAYAARDPKVAQRGVLISIVCWIVFDFLTTASGLYARAVLPNLRDPVFAYPELARVMLPPGVLGLFYLAMIATVMSTIDSYGFIAASTIGRDVIWRLRGRPGEEHLKRDTQLGLWLSAAFATALALANPSVVGIWHDIGSITTPALLLPVGTALLGRGRIAPAWTAAAMIAALAASLAWELARTFGTAGGVGAYTLGIEPIYAGLATSLAIYAAGWAAQRPRAPRAAPVLGWAVGPAVALIVALAPSPGRAQGAMPDTSAASDTLAKIVRLPEVVVSTARADQGAPIARSSLDRAALERRNWGQDTPMALATLPGVYAYSDAGSGIGYSYLSIRGFPQRRISVLINGVPLNDPESHEVYWIDHPDLLASTSDLQLQRGVGSALYGAASLGGSVNLETASFGEAPRATAVYAYGSYDTRRLMVELDPGPLAGGWNVYGRYSRITSDGYRDRSDTELWSYAFSARKVTDRHSLRLNLYGGPETTHLAYLGVSSDYLNGLVTGDADRDRRFNPLEFAGERDHFYEPHFEIVHTWAPSSRLTFSHTLFYFHGEGYYDEQRFAERLADYRISPWQTLDPTLFGADSLTYYANDGTTLTRDAQGRVTVEGFDAVRRRWVENRHAGWIPRVRIVHAGGELTLGGELRWHDGHHVGTVLSGPGLPPGIEPDHIYYDFHPNTLAGGLFAREEWRLRPRLLVTADLGWRHQSYAMRGDRTDPLFHPDAVRFDQAYDFGTPRLGLTWTPRPDWSLFAAVSHARREPALRDLYDGESAGSLPLYAPDPLTGAPDFSRPLIRPERVNDYEVGASWGGSAASVTANLFRMDFRDELVYAGQFNTDLGYPILGNAARSVHQGLELAVRSERASARGLGVTIEANTTLGDNHFVRYREIDGTAPGDTIVYDGKAIGFFPAVLANGSVRFQCRGATLGAEAQYAGRQYLDNSEAREGSIAPHTVLNLSAGYRLARTDRGAVALSVRVFNALDTRYETGGYSYLYLGQRYTDFIPAATRNVLGEIRIGF